MGFVRRWRGGQPSTGFRGEGSECALCSVEVQSLKTAFKPSHVRSSRGADSEARPALRGSQQIGLRPLPGRALGSGQRRDGANWTGAELCRYTSGGPSDPGRLRHDSSEPALPSALCGEWPSGQGRVSRRILLLYQSKTVSRLSLEVYSSQRTRLLEKPEAFCGGLGPCWDPSIASRFRMKPACVAAPKTLSDPISSLPPSPSLSALSPTVASLPSQVTQVIHSRLKSLPPGGCQAQPLSPGLVPKPPPSFPRSVPHLICSRHFAEAEAVSVSVCLRCVADNTGFPSCPPFCPSRGVDPQF